VEVAGIAPAADGRNAGAGATDLVVPNPAELAGGDGRNANSAI
jgi:hypothetical protein